MFLHTSHASRIAIGQGGRSELMVEDVFMWALPDVLMSHSVVTNPSSAFVGRRSAKVFGHGRRVDAAHFRVHATDSGRSPCCSS